MFAESEVIRLSSTLNDESRYGIYIGFIIILGIFFLFLPFSSCLLLLEILVKQIMPICFFCIFNGTIKYFFINFLTNSIDFRMKEALLKVSIFSTYFLSF